MKNQYEIVTKSEQSVHTDTATLTPAVLRTGGVVVLYTPDDGEDEIRGEFDADAGEVTLEDGSTVELDDRVASVLEQHVENIHGIAVNHRLWNNRLNVYLDDGEMQTVTHFRQHLPGELAIGDQLEGIEPEEEWDGNIPWYDALAHVDADTRMDVLRARAAAITEYDAALNTPIASPWVDVDVDEVTEDSNRVEATGQFEYNSNGQFDGFSGEWRVVWTPLHGFRVADVDPTYPPRQVWYALYQELTGNHQQDVGRHPDWPEWADYSDYDSRASRGLLTGLF
ncbi:hypothetical protein C475_08847 [Halosimplex carlsbadense 2-9-1]|uniref:Uncharacterized protein n=1 Tax=Halosimplex carlsbadense 2-9-1 TaxID=797114 RepID=M0CTK2_9EURY|nr:hypothetical protein [Halosimplex carlsbadense]ELZ26521.1 hypothetical protein C475_08847 [Halosimplex carlsbadense 2-9-1]